QYIKIRNNFTQFKNDYNIDIKTITENYDRIRKELDEVIDSLNNKKGIKEENRKPEPVVISTHDLILEYRAQLPELKVGEKVLAKWSDDNWYYRSTVEKKIDSKEPSEENFLYKIKDSASDHEEIYREDIIRFKDNKENFNIGDFVVAEHPDFAQSFAPGQIIGIRSDCLIVEFYDSIEHRVETDTTYKIPSFKYQLDIDSIIKAERQWIGHKCVFRSSKKKRYETGEILGRLGNRKKFKILSDKGEEEIINIIHIFGNFTRKRPIRKDDFVLAPLDEYFFPGKVETCNENKENQIEVVFADKKRNDNVKAENCFWLSKEYYDDFVLFYESKETGTNKIPTVDASDFN
ncbi:von Willebrand factor A domain-containing 3B-like, partial [Brachionus plicatilis]